MGVCLTRTHQIVRICPLVSPWIADILEVEVNSRAALSIDLFTNRQASDITEIVVGEKQRDIVRRIQTGLIVCDDFLVQRPDLCEFVSR